METVLKVSQVNKSFKSGVALKDINMQIKKGEIYGFIGRNGAGKSTLMKIICGLTRPTSGAVELFGRSGDNLSEARQKLGVVIENPALYPALTAYDNLEITRRLLDKVPPAKIDEVLKTVGLADTGKKKVKTFSMGMKQRLSLAMALLNEPELLILDEPTNGLDPVGIIEIREVLTRLSRDLGLTIFISSHILTELHQLATRFGIIEEGVLMKEMTAEELSKIDDDLESYFLSVIRGGERDA